VLGSQDVGSRVVVRWVIGRRGDRPMMTDSLGELIAYTDSELTVATRRGPVTVPLAAVVAAKRIPPPPARR
jgi:N-acetylglutamate synthase